MTLSLLPAAVAEQDNETPETPAAGEPSEETEAVFEEPAEEPAGEPEDAELTPRGDITVTAGFFPDENFRNWIKANITGGSDTLTQAQMDAVTTMWCDHENISSLKGISRFKNLQYLYCQYNNISDLDLTGNRQLLVADCSHNQLTKLSVSSCTELWHLNCSNNKLSSVNLSYNKKLRELDIGDNQMAKLSFDSNAALESICAANNKISSVKVTGNTKLSVLNLNSNQVSKIDLSKNAELTYLSVNKNQLSSLDVSKNTKLLELSANYNTLTSIDVSKATSLVTLDLSFNELKSINVTKNPNLQVLNVVENGAIKTLDVSKNTALKELHCDGNALTELNVSACPQLAELTACSNGLRALDVTKNTNLTRLSVYDNGIAAIDVSKNTKLKELDVASNSIGSLNVANSKDLTYLDCGNNQIGSLNLNNNNKLVTLYCQCNRLDMLSLGPCPQLETLECSGNHIRALHLNGNTKLKNPSLSNQITTCNLALTYSGGKYQFNMRELFETGSELAYVKAYDSTYSYNAATGIMTMPGNVTSFKYRFNTGMGDMIVEVSAHYTGDFTIGFEDYAVEYKGTTPYVVYNGAEQRPAFWVKKSNGQYISIESGQFDFWYTDNAKPGTGYLHVRLYGGAEKTLWFKIYMPATTGTTVENVQDGILIAWTAVKDAKGYVIYRRAWSSTTNGWTSFQRWNNTTQTTWKDTKVYAGTRYQYGIKAYYNDPMDNYNLGLVGPLKTTVRITTRVLNSVTGGSKQVTVKWSPSKNFTGYEVQIATDAAFTQNVKTVKISNAKTSETTIKSLKAKTTYYARVRSYHEFEGMTYYGQWSNVKSATTK